MGSAKKIYLALALVAAALCALGLTAIESRSLVGARMAANPSDVERALQLMRHHDPRRQRAGVVRVLAAEQRDLNLLLEHAASRWPRVAARVQLEKETAVLMASLSSPLSWPGHWLNIELRWQQIDARAQVVGLRVGRIPLPAWSAEPLALALMKWRGYVPDAAALDDVIRHVDLRQGRVLVFYAWQADTSARVLGALVPNEEQDRLKVYSDALVAILAKHVDTKKAGTADAGAKTVSMARLLPPLFDLARERSAAGSDAAAENRAAILALTFYANQLGLEAIVPAAREWPRAKPLALTLAGRKDLPLHYLISAALAATAGSSLADAVGLYKEMADSRGGSGFSFNDLAADRAGTRFGERAVRDPLGLQRHIVTGADESSLLPDIADLPESMQASEFTTRFGGVGGDAYRQMLQEIETRLDLVPALR